MAYKDYLNSLPQLSSQEKKQKKSLLKRRVNQIDFDKIKNVADLVEAYQDASIQARNVGQCASLFVCVCVCVSLSHWGCLSLPQCVCVSLSVCICL